MKKIVTVIFLVLSCLVSGQTAEELEMVSLINQVRTNPKSFIPVIEAYIASANKLNKIGATFTSKKTGKKVDVVTEANNLIIILKTIKPVKSLTLSTVLYPLTKAQVIFLDSTKQLIHTGRNGQSLEVRTKVTGLLVGENCGTGNTAVDAMIQLLIDLSSQNKGHRDNILNAKYKQISVAKAGNTWVQDFTL